MASSSIGFMDPNQTGYASIHMPSGYTVTIRNLYGKQLTLQMFEDMLLPDARGIVTIGNEYLWPERLEFIPSAPVSMVTTADATGRD